jgi:hypothetical protein
MPSVERFAYVVPTIADLESHIQRALAPHVTGQDVIRKIIYTPRLYSNPRVRKIEETMRAYRGRPPASVLVLTEDRLLAVTVPEPPAAPSVVATPLLDLLRLDLGTILLLGWIEWTWASSGQLMEHQVFFNTVGEPLLWDLVTAIRRTIIDQSDLPQQAGRSKDEAFDDLPYKFANLVPNKMMLPDEEVLALVYQPAIWQRVLGLFKRRRGPATAVALSNEHLLIAQEDVPAAGAAYGMIARYCPRSRVAAVAAKRTEEDLWLVVTLQWHGVKEDVRVLFQPAAEPALQAFLAQAALLLGAGRAGSGCLLPDLPKAIEA